MTLRSHVRSTEAAPECSCSYSSTATNWTLFRAVTGDPVDGVTGVPGIGPVLAREIIGAGTLDLIDPARLRHHRRAAIRHVADLWPTILATQGILTIDTSVAVPLHPAGLASTPPLPTAAQVVDHLGLW